MSQLAQVLAEREQEILQRWVARVRQPLAPGGKSPPELEDHLPLLLRQLQGALRGESSREHGAQRFRWGFSLGALVREYGVLRDVLLDLVAEALPQVSLKEVRRLTDFVATAIAEAVEAHTQQAEASRAALLDALAAQSLVAVSYLRGPDHITETANASNRQLAGREAMGLAYRDAFPELHQQGFTALLDRVRETGEPLVGREVPLQLAETPEAPAHELILDFTYQPVRAPGGGAEGILTLALDVTQQVLLKRSAQGLALEERRLRDFEQHLIGIVSHDLRNPLSAILLATQAMLRRGGLDARTLQYMARLKSSAERAVRMVRDLLDFTQARLGGGLKVARAPADVHALARAVVDEFQVTHPTRELRLEQRGEGRGDWDADRVAQMLGNLVTNALKYSPADTPVTVRSLGSPEEVRLEVHNGGVPIAPEALPRLFQPLQRAVEGIDKATRSVGLGLYIVEQIARAHGGTVQVTSSAEAGTRFTVRLPRTA